MALEYKLREFTVDEYHRLTEVGVLRSGERVELLDLLDGHIAEMGPIGTVHWGATRASLRSSSEYSAMVRLF